MRRTRAYRARLAAALGSAGAVGMVAAAVGVAPPALGAAGCSAAYTVTSRWGGGFGADVTVTNLGEALDG